jgi:hypothetical protein
LVTLSFNCFWIPCAISLNFLVMFCHSLIIIWLLFPSSRYYIKATIFSSFFIIVGSKRPLSCPHQ